MGKPEGKTSLGRPTRRWWIILKWIFMRLNGVVCILLIWLRIGTSGGLL
jgi:hypothetical protein